VKSNAHTKLSQGGQCNKYRKLSQDALELISAFRFPICKRKDFKPDNQSFSVLKTSFINDY
jgi:hypothetical protein